MDREQETRTVKRVLQELGIEGAEISHDRGEAGDLLRIKLPPIETLHRFTDKRDRYPRKVRELPRKEMTAQFIYQVCLRDCPACYRMRERYFRVMMAVKAATGRNGISIVE